MFSIVIVVALACLFPSSLLQAVLLLILFLTKFSLVCLLLLFHCICSKMFLIVSIKNFSMIFHFLGALFFSSSSFLLIFLNQTLNFNISLHSFVSCCFLCSFATLRLLLQLMENIFTKLYLFSTQKKKNFLHHFLSCTTFVSNYFNATNERNRK